MQRQEGIEPCSESFAGSGHNHSVDSSQGGMGYGMRWPDYTSLRVDELIHNTIGPTMASRKITLATISHSDA